MQRIIRSFTAAVLGGALLAGISVMPAAAQEATSNPFGVYFTRGVHDAGAVAVDMGATAARPPGVWLEGRPNSMCRECPSYEANGIDVLLTVRASYIEEEVPSPFVTKSAPPADLNAYKEKLATVIDQAQPEVIVVENEETEENQFTGTPEQYLAELTAACEVAHAKGILCTNGGLPGGKAIRMTYINYLDKGLYDEALDFGTRLSAGSEEYASMLEPGKRNLVRDASDEGHAFVDGYAAAGVDYVNFHWYEADSQAFGEVAAFLGETTGRPVITNEIGQRTDDPVNMVNHMQKALDLGLDYQVWWSIDKANPDPNKTAIALLDKNQSLRRHGEAFTSFVGLKTGTRLTTLTSTRTLTDGGTRVDLAGHVSGNPACVGGQVVELLRWKWQGTSASTIATTTTGADGSFAFVQGLKTEGKKFQVVAPAVNGCGRSESLIVTAMPAKA